MTSAGDRMMNRLARLKAAINPKYLKVAGWTVTVLSLLFVAWSLARSDLFSQSHLWTVQLGAAILGGAVLYAASLFLLAWGWTSLVRAASGRPLAFRTGLYVYARSQIYKYIPSNVLHYVGRQVLLAKRGFSHAAIAVASLAETLTLIACALMTAGVLGAATLWAMADADTLRDAAILAGVAICLVLAAAAMLTRLGLLSSLVERIRLRALWKSLLLAGGLFMVFFVFSGVAFWLVLSVGAQAAAPLVMAVAVAAGAWVLGFITPGASAGLGVREALIIAGLTANGISGDQAVLAAIAYRMVTTLGDVLFAGAGFVLRDHNVDAAAPARAP